MRCSLFLFAALVLATPVFAQTADDPMPDPIEAEEGVIRVNTAEFATLPDIDGVPARMMLLATEPGTRRIFVNDMRGPLYSTGYGGGEATLYLDTNEERWGYPIQFAGRERGFQSFAFHPQFNEPGAPGYGKFYTYTDILDTSGPADFTPGGGSNTHHTVLLEWTARTPSAATYDGGPPRQMMRFEQPFANHNAGHLAFNPNARPGDPDYGMLYMGVADGGSGGDPLNLSLNLGNAFGKIFRIDPLGTNSSNGRYGIPSDNPFVGRAGVLPEIYAYGARNPQRFGWDPQNGNLFMADIGQNIVEKLTLVPRGANLGWNAWEGSFRYIDRTAVGIDDPRTDPEVTYPVVEYDQSDPLFLPNSAITGVHVYRSNEIPALSNLVIFGDFPIGELFYISADRLPEGGNREIRRILFNQGGEASTLLEVVQAKNRQQGREPAARVDMRLGSGPEGELFIINKADGVVRKVVP